MDVRLASALFVGYSRTSIGSSWSWDLPSTKKDAKACQWWWQNIMPHKYQPHCLADWKNCSWTPLFSNCDHRWSINVTKKIKMKSWDSELLLTNNESAQTVFISKCIASIWPGNKHTHRTCSISVGLISGLDGFANQTKNIFVRDNIFWVWLRSATQTKIWKKFKSPVLSLKTELDLLGLMFFKSTCNRPKTNSHRFNSPKLIKNSFLLVTKCFLTNLWSNWECWVNSSLSSIFNHFLKNFRSSIITHEYKLVSLNYWSRTHTVYWVQYKYK